MFKRFWDLGKAEAKKGFSKYFHLKLKKERLKFIFNNILLHVRRNIISLHIRYI